MDRDFLHDLFASFGAIDIRRMFGGLGLSVDGVMFAIVADDALYLKTDDEMIPRFEAEGCSPFRYEMKGRLRIMKSYWRMPERLYDDPDETADWARASLDVARRATATKGVKKRKPGVEKGVKKTVGPRKSSS